MGHILELNSLADELLQTIASNQKNRTASGEGQTALQWHKFDDVKRLYSSEEYISPEAVRVAVGTVALHPVLQKANAATLAFYLSTTQEGTGTTLDSLNRNFPHLLGQPITEANFPLVLDLRTHSVIDGWRRNRNSQAFNPNDLITHFFYFTDDAIKEYDGWAEAKRQRIRELDRYYGRGGIDFAGLARSYPWQEFTRRMLSFVWVTIGDASKRGLCNPAIDKAKAWAAQEAAAKQRPPPSTMNPSSGPAVKAKDAVSR